MIDRDPARLVRTNCLNLMERNSIAHDIWDRVHRRCDFGRPWSYAQLHAQDVVRTYSSLCGRIIISRDPVIIGVLGQRLDLATTGRNDCLRAMANTARVVSNKAA